MIHLSENEKYTIESLDDLMNCPVNMMDEVVNHIRRIFLKRIELMEKREKSIDFKNITIDLVNDGMDKTNILLSEAKEVLQ